MSLKTKPSGVLTDREAEAGYKRNLSSRHIQMIALGGAIGTGLFYGSSAAIQLAGPSILLAYLVGGTIVFLIVRALGEMSVAEPVSGAFSFYAYKHWSRRAGFVAGWNYWFTYIAVAMAELEAVGEFVNYWLPGVPKWVTAAFFLVVITATNLLSVKVFGETEFWLSLIKVLAVVGMIVFGVVIVVLGLKTPSADVTPSFSHLFDQGGFFPNGVTGFLLALVVVAFSFGGTELVGVTAGEAENPEKTIPQAINQVILRILIFYVGALAVIMAVIPWFTIDGSMSPFVQIFDTLGIASAAHILNFVVIVAAASVYNSSLYANGRMLYTLSQQGNAPTYLQKMSSSGQPWAAILTSSIVTVAAVFVVMVWPDFAFTFLMGLATFAVAASWFMITMTEYKFRRGLTPGERAALKFKLPGGRAATVLILAFLALLFVLMFFSPSFRLAAIIGPLWIVFLLVAYQVRQGISSRS